VEEQKVELLRDVIANIKEEYFSDLNPEDIPDDEVSDVDESLLDLDSIPAMQTSQEISSKIKV
jgi:replication fork clamp-binding protein CrfC